jgi:hypothetical protein
MLSLGMLLCGPAISTTLAEDSSDQTKVQGSFSTGGYSGRGSAFVFQDMEHCKAAGKALLANGDFYVGLCVDDTHRVIERITPGIMGGVKTTKLDY